MVKRDAIFDMLEDVVDKWFRIPQKIRMHNQVHKYHPELLSLTVKRTEEYDLSANRGGAIQDKDTILARGAMARVDTLVGENRKYLDDSEIDGTVGCVSGSENFEIPWENLDAAKKSIEDKIDTTAKNAFSRFLNRHENAIHEKVKNFIVLSDEDPVEYYGPEKSVKLELGDLIKMVENVGAEIDKHSGVTDSSVHFNVLKTNRYLVSAERNRNARISWNKIFTSEVHGYITLTATCKNQDGREMSLCRRIMSTNYKELTDEGEIMRIKEELLRDVEDMKASRDIPGGIYNVVFSGAALGILVHEAVVAHLLSSKQIDKEKEPDEEFLPSLFDDDSTPFADQLGKEIMPDFINIYDDPTLKDGWASFPYDEQGVPAKRKCLIENGVLKELLFDRYTAGRRRMKSNACSRAEYTNTPEPRVSTIIVEAAENYPKYSEEDLINMMILDCKERKMEYGLYIEGESGSGEVKPGVGTFTQYAPRIVRIFTDGRREHVSGINIKEMSMGVLRRIVAIADNPEEWKGLCGAYSGLIPQTEIAPSGYARGVEFHKDTTAPPTERLDRQPLGQGDFEVQ